MHRGGFPPGPPFRDEMMLSGNLRPEVDLLPLNQDPMDPKRQRALRSAFSKDLIYCNICSTIIVIFINAHHTLSYNFSLAWSNLFSFFRWDGEKRKRSSQV